MTRPLFCYHYSNNMATNTQFSIAAHIMACLGHAAGEEVNSAAIAGSVNTSASFVRRILAKLFSGEFKAMEVLKLKDIVESLEEAIDCFERVANTVEQIAVKES